MTKFRIQPIMDWLRRVITQPTEELTRWQATVRFAADLSRYGARQMRRDQAPRMAAALAFRTLFGLLPVFVVGTLLVRAFGGFDQLWPSLLEFFNSLKLDELSISAGGEGAGTGGETETLSTWLMNVLRSSEEMKLAAIGWIGVAVLIYAVVSLMVTIEGCFNNICHAPSGRSWTRRFPLYWTVISLAPAAIAGTAYVDGRFDYFLEHAVSWRWALVTAPMVWGFIVTWLLMFVIYKLLPNTSVQTRSALIGAFIAAILLEIGRRALGAYVANALSVKFLSGSLGLIPLFMFWIYIMWLVILFGLEVTATLQVLSGREIKQLEQRRTRTGLVDPAAVLAVMHAAASAFQKGTPTTPTQMAEQTALDEVTVDLIVDRLRERSLLVRVQGGDGALSLARPAEQIETADLLAIGFELADSGESGGAGTVLARLREAQRQTTAGISLHALLGEAATGPDQAAPV